MLFTICSILLFSCVGIPEPKTEEDYLIIGNLLIDFPDGFMSLVTPKTFKDGVKIYVENLTTGKGFYVKTKDNGYYYFRFCMSLL